LQIEHIVPFTNWPIGQVQVDPLKVIPVLHEIQFVAVVIQVKQLVLQAAQVEPLKKKPLLQDVHVVAVVVQVLQVVLHAAQIDPFTY
jgi:hypothetical protein